MRESDHNTLASYPVEKELFVLIQNSWLIRKQCFAITSITLWIMYAYRAVLFERLLRYINVFFLFIIEVKLTLKEIYDIKIEGILNM